MAIEASQQLFSQMDPYLLNRVGENFEKQLRRFPNKINIALSPSQQQPIIWQKDKTGFFLRLFHRCIISE